MNEEWKIINDSDLKHIYLINIEGVVKRLDTGRIMKHTKHIYPRVSLRHKLNKTKPLTVHRLIAMHFIENEENKELINHKDGNKYNYNVTNLEWCTSSENNLHAFEFGLRKGQKGQTNPMAKLSESEVVDIKKRIARGEKISQITKDYKISKNHLYKVKKGIRWGHIKI